MNRLIEHRNRKLGIGQMRRRKLPKIPRSPC
jgi:hypothetical protein